MRARFDPMLNPTALPVNSISQTSLVDLDSLIRCFYPDPTTIGLLRRATADDLPATARALLAHSGHMTETVEKFHGCSVDVEILRQKRYDAHYAREILLRRQSDRCIVQYGIVRLNFDFLDPDVIREIEAGQKPLGRILIDHNVLRTVRLDQLLLVEPSDSLRRMIAMPEAKFLFGRTAEILCDDAPAVELLEILCNIDSTPAGSPAASLD